MKRTSLLVGLVMLALAGGCAFVLDKSESQKDRLGNPYETVHLLQEKLGYQQRIEADLRDSLAAAKGSPTTTDEQKRNLEVRLLEAGAQRVTTQLELAQWRAMLAYYKVKKEKQ